VTDTTATTTVQQLTRVVVRMAGDSGDGIQLIGTLFSTEAAIAGADLATLPSFPAEIRAPAGTTYGVSSYQIQFGSQEEFTPGDRVDALVAFNPAALKVHLGDLKPGGIILVNAEAFDRKGLEKAGYDHNPLDDEKLAESYRLIRIDISTQVCRDLEATVVQGKGSRQKLLGVGADLVAVQSSIGSDNRLDPAKIRQTAGDCRRQRDCAQSGACICRNRRALSRNV